MIHQKLESDLVEVHPIVPYLRETAMSASKNDILEKRLIDIKPLEIKLQDYQQIIIGTPVWWYSLTPPIRTWMNQCLFSGKQVKLFCTHAGDVSDTLEDMKRIAQERAASNIEVRSFYTGQKYKTPIDEQCWNLIEDEVTEWINR